MKVLRIEIPEKVTVKRVKTIIGPYIKVKGQYHLMLSFVNPGASYRWEPHLLIDRLGLLDESGIMIISGAITLAKYEGKREIEDVIMKKYGSIRLYVPPWGFPLLLVFEAREPEPHYLSILKNININKINELLKYMKSLIQIIEI